MKELKEYKGVAIMLIIFMVINMVWMVGFDNQNSNKQVRSENDRVVAFNA